MSDLLKEAIADAKTVRETAIANAKMALEEAFTPHLKSMLSAKLAEDDMEDEEEMDEMGHEEDEEEDAEAMSRSMRREDDDEEMDEMGHEGEEEEEMDEEGVIEINGVKYAPVVSEEEHEDDDPRREDDDDEMDEDIDNLDLESVIKELETEIAEAEEVDEELEEGGDKPRREDDDEDKVDEEIVVEEDEDDEKDEVDEQSKSSGIGAGDNKVNKASAGDEEDPGKGKVHESVNAMQKELNEYKEAVTFLREKLHEVNILNAKLLYTNRLFKEFALNNNQKLKIV